MTYWYKPITVESERLFLKSYNSSETNGKYFPFFNRCSRVEVLDIEIIYLFVEKDYIILTDEEMNTGKYNYNQQRQLKLPFERV